MNIWWDYTAALLGMAILMAVSAFFSASEAALFSLKASDIRRLEGASAGGRAVATLLGDPSRLLSAVLFWNLVVNVAFFALVSMVSIQLERNPNASSSLTVGFSIGALMTMIFVSEMLPKSVGVLSARHLASYVSVPLSVAVGALDPLMPVLRTVNLLSERLLWPGFTPEPYLEVADLERAVQNSTQDAQLQTQEHHVLHQLVSLSDLRVDEWMRPRSQLMILRPPVAWGAWGDELPPSGYLLVTEEDSDEIALWMNLEQLSARLPVQHLEYACQPVIYVPWCATVADTLEQMIGMDREVAVVVTERGETVGVLTMEDVLQTLFTSHGGRSERVFHESPIVAQDDGTWRVNGMTNLRRVAEHFSLELPPSRSVTVAGWLEECLERMPQAGDWVPWAEYQLHVVETPEDEPVVIQFSRPPTEPADTQVSEGT